ncbi:hypothetical protein LPJ63_004970 [Coemansia sp. RSA 2711]|nr:hypothetical protein LPJ63_004970 [Coemansia sp. RSA 2711]
MPSPDPNPSTASAREDEQEPLLSRTPPPELDDHTQPTAIAWVRHKARQAAGPATTLLGVCLATACLAIGFYILYILYHLPAMLGALRGSEPRVEAVSLIDMTDDAVLFAADVEFPDWGHRAAQIPHLNSTIHHRGRMVGWLYASNLEITPQQKRLSLCEIFHIVDPEAMARLLSEAASSRRVTVDARARVSLSGFGKYLPTTSVHRELDIVLPPLPAINATIRDFVGPIADTLRGGVTAQATVKLELPALVSANVSPVLIDISYHSIVIAVAEVGPVAVYSSGVGDVPLKVNLKQIADSVHEAALADIIAKVSTGEVFELVASGAGPQSYSTAPRWLRWALYNSEFAIRSDLLKLTHDFALPVQDMVKDLVVDKLYAYWSAEDSYKPWAGISARATIDIPNYSAANATFEIESLVPNLRLMDDEDQLPFAIVDTPSIPVELKQMAPLQFVVSCDYDRLGLRVVPGRELQFTRAMRRALADRHVALGVNGSLDIAMATSIGKIHISALPVGAYFDWKFDASPAVETAANPSAEVSVSRIHVADTTRDLISLEIGVNVNNPFTYGAFISDLALMVKYSGLHIVTIGVKELSLSQGANDVTLYVDFHNYPNDPRQRMLFLEASSGKNVTVEIAGFPNCTSIQPLETSLREFVHRTTINTDPSSGPRMVTGSLPQVLREVVFRIFAMSAEATIVNPVSGADVWLQVIEAIGYYKHDIPLGMLEYDFTSDGPKGLRLPFDRAVSTPRMPIVANETSIGWDVLRRAIGGTLDVDVFTNIQMQVGNAPLNFTVMGRNAPVKVRL